MPLCWWTNDIDGPFFYNGVYHLFFAYHENQTRFHGPNRWYHIVSIDLARWTVLAPALVPSEPYDITGIMSGSATLTEQGPFIHYSSIINNANGTTTQLVSLATPTNLSDPYLRQWTKHAGNPVLSHLLQPACI
jgi:beta-fructofuranosidase